MKKQKSFSFTIVLIIISMVIINSNVSAQDRQGPPQVPNSTQTAKMVKDMSAELSLNETQESEILILFTNHFAEIGNKGGKRKSIEEMESSKSKFEKQVKDLLTKEQGPKFDKFMKNLRPESNQQRPKR